MAENKQNTPDDKKTNVPANETEKNKTAVPVEPVKANGKTPDNNEPEKTATQQAGKPEQEKKTEAPADRTKAIADAAIKAEQEKKEKETAEKTDPAKDDKKDNKVRSLADERLKREQEALKKSLDEKAAQYDKKPPSPKKKMEGRPPTGIPKEKVETPAEPEKPIEPREAPRHDKKVEIVYLKLNELFPFKDHPFQVKDDPEMGAMVESVKDTSQWLTRLWR